MGEIKSILKVAGIYAATIIGAGFASGREIVQFFSNYYEGGFYGIILAGMLFSIIGCAVLDRVYTGRIQNYDEYLFPSVGWFAGWVMQIVAVLFVLSVFCVMVAGGGTLLAEKIGLPYNLCIVLMAMLCMAVILADIRGVAALGVFITPVLIVGIIWIGFYIMICKDVPVFNLQSCAKEVTDNWFFSSLVYVSYNSILSVVVMCSLLPYLKTRRVGIIGGILGGMILCFITLVLNTAIYVFYPEAMAEELPVLSIVDRYDGVMSNVYTVVLWLAMFVSAVTSGFCFVERLRTKIPLDAKIIAAIACALAVPMSSLGFSGIIAAIYPVFGYAGMFMVFVILIQWLNPTSNL